LDFAPFENVYYPPVATVVLGFRREDVGHPLDGFGMLIPDKEGFNILGALFSSSLFPNRAPKGEVTITCYIGGARNPELPLETPAELIWMAVKDITKLLNIKGEPTFRHCTVFRQAIPQYNVGFGAFRNLMSEMEANAPGLFLAGHARDGVSLSDSIVSGHNVASRITDYLAKTETETLDLHSITSL
jgi:oxygen-dependent protoporphyrinogen oxidase